MAEARGLELLVEWESAHGVTSAELAATWCRLEIQVQGQFVTAVDDARTGAMRRGVYTSAYPLAEWIVEHWWLLRTHVRPSAVPRRDWAWAKLSEQPWLRAHNARAAGGGLPWPDLTVVPEGATTRLTWNAGPGLADQPITFLTSGDAYVASDAAADALGRFVDQVLERLRDAGVSGTPLQEEWELIAGSDDEETAFASSVARLGLDPYDVPDELSDDVIGMAETLDDEVLVEFLDSVRPSELRTAAQWLEQAQSERVMMPRPALADRLEHAGASSRAQGQPWELGYAAASSYREQLGLRSREVFPMDRYVSTTPIDAPAGGLQGLVAVERDDLGLVLPTELGLSRNSVRFAQGRALGLSLLTKRPLLLLDPAHTDLSKAARAFAAELLAPADGISTYLSVLPEVTPAAFEAIAARFDTSPLLVQHQYENQIAR